MEKSSSFYQILRYERLRRGWSQAELAAKLGTVAKSISRWESGETIPTPRLRQKLAELFGKNLEELGFVLETAEESNGQLPRPSAFQSPKEDWDTAPSVENFLGRENELVELEQWIVEDHRRLIAIVGPGGIGKIMLATKAAKEFKDNFVYVFWRSLQYAPLLKEFLQEYLEFLCGGDVDVPSEEEDQISLLIDYLREERCLIVLDRFETVLQGGDFAGCYREGYEGYGKLIQAIGEVEHQSCLLLTSREQPKEVVHLQGTRAPVRLLELKGIGQTVGRKLIDEGLFGSEKEWEALIELYSGNPFALKLAASRIRGVFNGSIAEFLKQKEAVFGDIRDLLEEQFDRLSPFEQELMYWLAIEREAVSLDDLQADLVDFVPRGELLEALESLRRRSLIEIASAGYFRLLPMVMEYITKRLVEQARKEIVLEEPVLLATHALVKSQAKDYVRTSQIDSILAQVIKQLLNIRRKEQIEEKVIRMLSKLREATDEQPGYQAANLLHLLIHLGATLRGLDLSSLTIRQAYLQEVELPNVNFAHAHFAKTVFTDTFGSIFSEAFSLDGELLAAGTANGEIRLWRTEDVMPVHSYKGHAQWVFALAFSPVRRELLASGGGDGTVRLWDVNTGQSLEILEGHTGWVRAVAFSPSGEMLASGSEDKTIRIWNASTGDCLRVLRARSRVSSVVFLDEKHVASGSEDQTVHLWDIDTGQYFNILNGHTDQVWSVALSPDGKVLASGSGDKTIRLWDTATGECLKVLEGHLKRISSVVFLDEKHVASGSEDQTIRLWDIGSGRSFGVLRGHTSGIKALAFSRIDKVLASGSEDQTARLWDIKIEKCIKVLQGYTNRVLPIAFSPIGRILASGSEDKTIRLWNIRGEQCFKILYGHTNRIRALAFNSEGTIVASGSDDYTTRLWDIDTGQCLKILHEHTDIIRAVAFSPSGEVLASGSDDKTIRLWDARTGRCLKVLRGHEKRLRAVAFSPSGEILASGSEDKTIRLWDVRTGRCVKVLRGHKNRVWSVAFSPDGKTLASGSEDKTVRLWDVRTGGCFKVLQEHTSRVWSVAFNFDGERLASSCEDQTICLWKVSDGSLLFKLEDISQNVRSVVFSPDGHFLASASNDGTIKLWDVKEKAQEPFSILKSEGPYEDMDISFVTGLTEAQKITLKALGASEDIGAAEHS